MPAMNEASDGVFGDPWLELGTGTTAFASDGDAAPLIAGIQGGWHVDAGVAFGGFGPDGVVLVYEAVDTNADRVSFVTQAQLSEGSVLEAEDGWHRVGDRIVLDIASEDEVVGSELILKVTAQLEGQTWSDKRRVLVE